MSNHVVTFSLVAALVGAGAYAFFGDTVHGAPDVDARLTQPRPAAPTAPAADPSSDPLGEAPPNHEHAAPASTSDIAPNEEAAAIAWKAPAAWKSAPNPSSMRVATYKVPHAPADTDDADVSVVRAGGTVDANIDRWLGQFENAGKETRTVRTVRGFKITLVEVKGTYLGGGTGAGADGSKPGWAMFAAIVETPGSPYFFKMTGPAATVQAAHAPFDALIDSITPSN